MACNNRVVVLTRSSCEGVPLYYVIPVRHVRQDIFSVEDFGVLKSCFSYFIHFCFKLKIYDFIRPFYSCMLQLHAKDPSLRVHGIKDVGAFVHRTLSVTYVHYFEHYSHLKRSEVALLLKAGVLSTQL